MITLTQTDEAIFESEVRRIAAELFPRSKATGPVKLDGRERDGVYADGEIIHVVEATVSSKRAKAASDLEKSADLVKQLRRNFPDLNFKIWLVTKSDPTADQNALIQDIRKKSKCPVEICSFRTFSSRLVDASKYLEIRDNHPFGSIRRPEDDNDFRVPANEYVPIDLLQAGGTVTLGADAIADSMSNDPRILLLVGDFGAGKSMTLRHAYYGLKRKFMTGESIKFPVYLNLRDHFGQRSPSEALIRHGEEIGFPAPGQLVAAWKAGHCHIFLDGFDELSSTRLVRGVRGLRQARREAMRLVHGFVTLHPKDASLFISGREHYFDSIEELKSSLGLYPTFSYFTLNEFSQEQVVSYLKRKGFSDSIPDWLPSRPLLLGYLAIKGLLSQGVSELGSLSREEGWNHLLGRICEREAHQIDPVSIDPHAVREFVEGLATQCRQTNSGRGPVHLNDIRSSFEAVFSMPADEKAETLIFRMPGFTAASGQEDAREFIDDDYADACRSGDVVRFVNAVHDPRYSTLLSSSIEMGDLGCRMAARRLFGASPKKLSVALDKAADENAPYVAFDIVRILQETGIDYVGNGSRISDGAFRSLEFTPKPNLSNVVIVNSYFSEIITSNIDSEGPTLSDCHIDNLYGSVGSNDLPPAISRSVNVIGTFVDEAKTNADILDLPLPLSVKVLMTILRKLFVQAGRGRRENALYRGLDPRAKAYVQDILEIVEQLDFARSHRINGPVVWIPNRNKVKEAHRMLAAPQQSADSLMLRVKAL